MFQPTDYLQQKSI